MTRYEECLRRVRAHVERLRSSGTNPSAIEGLVRSYVEQPGYDITFRERLVQDAHAPGT
jgi:hypothetical protein